MPQLQSPSTTAMYHHHHGGQSLFLDIDHHHHHRSPPAVATPSPNTMIDFNLFCENLQTSLKSVGGPYFPMVDSFGFCLDPKTKRSGDVAHPNQHHVGSNKSFSIDSILGFAAAAAARKPDYYHHEEVNGGYHNHHLHHHHQEPGSRFYSPAGPIKKLIHCPPDGSPTLDVQQQPQQCHPNSHGPKSKHGNTKKHNSLTKKSSSMKLNKSMMTGTGSAINNNKSKRVRTIFTPEQLERLEMEFEKQQYMVGTGRLYLASTLNLTEAQVKVWFQNRRIKWRKQHLEGYQDNQASGKDQNNNQIQDCNSNHSNQEQASNF